MREPVGLLPLPLRRAVPIAASAGLLGALVLALVAPRVLASQGRVPPGQLPPPGSCRVWYENVPPGRQPAPTDCASARAEAWRTGGRVIVGRRGGDDGWWWGRDDRRDRRDAPWWWGRDRDRDGRWERDRDDRWERERRRDRDDDDDDDDDDRRRGGGWKRVGARSDILYDRDRDGRLDRWELEQRDRDRKREQVARERRW